MTVEPVNPGNNLPNIPDKGTYFSAIQALPLSLTSVITEKEATLQEGMFVTLAALKIAAKKVRKL